MAPPVGVKHKGAHSYVHLPSDFDAAAASIDGAAEAIAEAVVTEHKHAVPRAAKKAKKDPNAPKRPPNAFMQFAAVRRAEAAQENTDHVSVYHPAAVIRFASLFFCAQERHLALTDALI